MCQSCWEAYGSPTIVNERTKAAAKLIGEVYEHHGAGGNCHTIVDDWNLEDWCVDDSLKNVTENPLGEDQEEIAASKACLEALKSMSLQERASALALHDGYVEE